ncbi:MAG: hypothetical protein K8R85_00390 [Bacteroidetes bacterium]|nr:hypothetical protein [Bacteroidota bacterium]
MKDVLKILKDMKFYVIMLIASLLFIFLSMVKELPNQGNQYKIVLLENANIPLLSVGLVLLTLSCGLFLKFGKFESQHMSAQKNEEDYGKILFKKPDDFKKELSTINNQAKLVIEYPVINDVPTEEEVISTFKSLPHTQKGIMKIIYKVLHRQEISVDDLFQRIVIMSGRDAIGSEKELLYRVRLLSVPKLIRLEQIGERTTIVVAIPSIGKILIENKLLDS